jgi:hypothetical protein
MSKWLFCFILLFPVCFFGAPSKSGSVFTNFATVNISGVNVSQTNFYLTVGSFYGLSSLYTSSKTNKGYPNNQVKVPFNITNFGNDADSNFQISAELLSNNTGYSGSLWNFYVEVGGTPHGTNYTVPFALFGEGAILNFNLVVNIPADCPVNSTGFIRVTAATASNTTHIAAPFTGYNGQSYGGIDSSSNDIKFNVALPNKIVNVLASDGIDTINKFNGVSGLRKSQNTVFVELESSPSNLNSVRLWYAVNSQADGNIGPNGSDKSTLMRYVKPKQFEGVIPGKDLENGTNATFVFEIDNITYMTNLIYKLLDLTSQEGYESVLMHNIISYKSDDSIYIKMPSKLMGKQGRVMVFSVSGDLVDTICSGVLNTQILKWDGKDRTKAWVSKGMYYIVIDFADVKEVRKTFVK